MGYKVEVRRTINRPRGDVFEALMDFGAIARLAPDQIATCRVEGSGVGAVRHFTLKGSDDVLAERLDCAHDQSVFSYTLITPTALGVEHYHAVVILADAPDGGCAITWSSNWISRTPPEAEVAAMLAEMYGALIDAIAKG
jgi:uncharacterized protein YndB with AHSA1/START domain